MQLVLTAHAQPDRSMRRDATATHLTSFARTWRERAFDFQSRTSNREQPKWPSRSCSGRRPGGPVRNGITRFRAETLAIGMVLLTLPLTIASAGNIPVAHSSRPDPESKRPTGIIVLGGDLSLFLQYPKLSPGNVPNTRLARAIELAREFPQAIVLYTGQESAPGPMPTLLQGGIARQRIIWEDRSRSTAQNATFSANLVHPHPAQTWLLVTDDWHMARAEECFERAGFNVTPEPVHRSSSVSRTVWQTYHELFGRFAYSLFNLCSPA